MEINVNYRYAAEYQYYHQRAYHTDTRYFTNKRELIKFCKQKTSDEQTVLRTYSVAIKRIKNPRA